MTICFLAFWAKYTLNPVKWTLIMVNFFLGPPVYKSECFSPVREFCLLWRCFAVTELETGRGTSCGGCGLQTLNIKSHRWIKSRHTESLFWLFQLNKNGTRILKIFSPLVRELLGICSKSNKAKFLSDAVSSLRLFYIGLLL